jgi:hypothetical protein
MTDEQRHIIQGRARDEAKKLKAELSTLRTFFQDYSETLQGTQNAINSFLSAPAARAADDHPMIDHLNRLHRKLSDPGFFENTAEFEEKTRKLQTLEERIKDF